MILKRLIWITKAIILPLGIITGMMLYNLGRSGKGSIFGNNGTTMLCGLLLTGGMLIINVELLYDYFLVDCAMKEVYMMRDDNEDNED